MPIYKTKPAYYTYAALSIATAMAGTVDNASQFWERVRTPLKTMGFLTVKQAKRGELMPPNVGDFFMNASGPILWPQGLGESQQKESSLLVGSPGGGFLSFMPSKGGIEANFLPQQEVGIPFLISSAGRDPQETVSSGEDEITSPLVFLSPLLEGQALNPNNLKKEILLSRRNLSLTFDPESKKFLNVNVLNAHKVSSGKKGSGAAHKLAAIAHPSGLSKIQKGLTTSMASPKSLKGKGVPSSVKSFIEPMPENLKHPLIDLETRRLQGPDIVTAEAMEEEVIEETLTLDPMHLPKRTVATFLRAGISKTPIDVFSKKASPKAFLSTSMQILAQETVTFLPEGTTLQESLPSLTVSWEKAKEENAPTITLLHTTNMQRKTTLESQDISPLEAGPVLFVDGSMPYNREPNRLEKSTYKYPLSILLAFQRRPLTFRGTSHLEIKFSWHSLQKIFPSHTIQSIPQDPLVPSLLEASTRVTQSLKTLFQLSFPSTGEGLTQSSLQDSNCIVRGTLPFIEEAALEDQKDREAEEDAKASVIYTQFKPQNLHLLSTYANLSEDIWGVALGKDSDNSNLQWLLERLKKLLKKREQEVKVLKMVLHTLEAKAEGERRDDLVPPLATHIHFLKTPQLERGGELLGEGSLSPSSFGFPTAPLGDIKEDVFSGGILIPHQEKIDPNED